MSGTEQPTTSGGLWDRRWPTGVAALTALTGLSLLALGPAGLALGVREQLQRRTEAAALAEHTLGTEVRDGPVSFVVHTVHCGPAESDTTNGQLCEVTIGARNDGTEPLAVPGPAQLLFGTAGARLRPVLQDPEPFGRIGPGQAATATIPFDVPSTSVITHVEVHATPYTRGQPVALGGPPLPLPAKADRPAKRAD